jgi:hypothetical protein
MRRFFRWLGVVPVTIGLGALGACAGPRTDGLASDDAPGTRASTGGPATGRGGAGGAAPSAGSGGGAGGAETGGPAAGGGPQAGTGGAGQGSSAPADAPLAAGLTITGIELTQAVAIPLMKDGQAAGTLNAPIVVGRSGLVRVYVQPAADWQPRDVRARLVLSGAGPEVRLETTGHVTSASTGDDLGSTLDIAVPPGVLATGLGYSVSLHEAPGGSGPGTQAGARFPAQGTVPLGARDAHGPFELVLVPFSYQADGSNRLPDTSAAQLDTYLRRFRSTYPVADVHIDVHAALPFSSQFSAQGQGWSDLLDATCAARQSDAPADEVYYFGMLAPADSFDAYCGGSCVTGLGVVTTDPDDVSGRCASGLGFSDERSANTALHEVAHALGRAHAPCGNPSQVDPSYPYPGAAIGSQGYDLATKQLLGASFVDFMSYCTPVWISDYTYSGLFERIAHVNGTAKSVVERRATLPWRDVLVGGDGSLRWGSTVRLPSEPGGLAVRVELLDRGGRRVGELTGRFRPYDHLPGGSLLVPARLGPDVAAVSFEGRPPLRL